MTLNIIPSKPQPECTSIEYSIQNQPRMVFDDFVEQFEAFGIKFDNHTRSLSENQCQKKAQHKWNSIGKSILGRDDGKFRNFLTNVNPKMYEDLEKLRFKYQKYINFANRNKINSSTQSIDRSIEVNEVNDEFRSKNVS